jgi:hypothetical protein
VKTWCWVRLVTPNRTCLFIVLSLKNISRVDLMHGGCFDQRVWSFFGGAWVWLDLTRRWRARSSFVASGHHLKYAGMATSRWHRVADIRSRGHMALIERPDAGCVRPVRSQWAAHGAQQLYFVGLLFKLHGQLKLNLLAICIDIATLWA